METALNHNTPPIRRTPTVTYKKGGVEKWPDSGGGSHYHQPPQPGVKNNINNTNATDYCVLKNMRVHQKSLSSRISSLKRESKTTRTLSMVVGGFIACWLPFFINYLVTPFLPPDTVNPVFARLLVWLGWINSAINPFIYAFYSVDFRAAFWRLTLKRFFRSSRKPPFTTNTLSIRR